MQPNLKDLKSFLFNFKLEKDEGNEYSITPELQQIYNDRIAPELIDSMKKFFKRKRWTI